MIHEKVEEELGVEQSCFRKERKATGRIFSLRQMVEKMLELGDNPNRVLWISKRHSKMFRER